MKKTYSDPLMFSNILLTGGTIDTPVSQTGGFPNGAGTLSTDSNVAGNASLSIASGSADNIVASASEADIQIVEPEQKSEPTITEESIQSVIDQIMGEDTETPPSDESSLAD